MQARMMGNIRRFSDGLSMLAALAEVRADVLAARDARDRDAFEHFCVEEVETIISIDAMMREDGRVGLA